MLNFYFNRFLAFLYTFWLKVYISDLCTDREALDEVQNNNEERHHVLKS